MAFATEATKHAGHRFRLLFRAFGAPVRGVEKEAQHLHTIEHEGESAATPAIAVAGLLLFLVPIFLIIVGLAFAAYYIAN
jgi:hypothetical protein